MELTARYKYRLRVKPHQTVVLQSVFDVNRFVWNTALGRWSGLWRDERLSFSYVDACRELTDWRARYEWLAAEPVVPQQQTIIDLWRTISAFFDPKNPAGRPRFKSRAAGHATARWTARGFKVTGTGIGSTGDRLEVATSSGRVGLRVVWSRPLPSTPKSVTVYRDPAGRWWASFVVRIESACNESTGRTTGVDVGLNTLATTTDETFDVPNPRFAKQDRRLQRKADQNLSRKQDGSKNREKARRSRARCHTTVANRRNDHAHKTARPIAGAFDTIGVEDLRIKNMMANRCLARAITDAGWGNWVRVLEWQATKAGHRVVRVNPRGTTQNCSRCGVKAKRHVGLNDRVFSCSECGLVLDRDRNAARNLDPGLGYTREGVDGDKTGSPCGNNQRPESQNPGPSGPGVVNTLAAGLVEVREASIESQADWTDVLATVAQLGAVHVNVQSRHECSAVATIDTPTSRAVALLHAEPAWDDWKLTVAADSAQTADRVLDGLQCVVPVREPVGESTLDVTFWMMHPMAGAVSRRRALDRLSWTEVAVNYPPSIRGDLDNLSALTTAPSQGRLMVFHGPPGTGKTRFVQSLADSWASWADVHYVVDPDEMLRSALYLNTVLLDGEGSPDRWRLLVIEDGDEFIDNQAKDRTGHAIARLLNVADGLIGQGLKVMVLVSTNVSQARFAEAVVRTGRCGALVEFPPFTTDEAAAWCAERGVPHVGREATLAELYALTH